MGITYDEFDDGWVKPDGAAPSRKKNTPPPPRSKGQGGRGPTRFAFTYADLARVLGMREGAIRTAVHRGKFSPRDLADVIRFWQARQG